MTVPVPLADPSVSRPVLILGGYGVFGSRIAKALIGAGVVVVVAGRSEAAAVAFCAAQGGHPLRLDRDDPGMAAVLAGIVPFLVIDAAGPFQAYSNDPYCLHRAALAAGAHSIDLSDDAAFTGGIVALDDSARAAGLVVLSGVSSVPALSSAAVVALSKGLVDPHLIEIAIMPGNRAPRGLSVMRAILAQVGRPMRVWTGGRWETRTGWSDGRLVRLDPGMTRRASLIGAPDLALFPGRFRARSVLFRAGLELAVMQWGLAALAVPVRIGLIGSLAPMAAGLKWVADRLERFGTDRGGMRVTVLCVTTDGREERHAWTLIAGAGDGPQVPGIAAAVVHDALRRGALVPGARPCLAEFPLTSAEAAMAAFDIRTSQSATPVPLLFRKALAEDFDALPAPLQDLHRVLYLRRWAGRATVVRGASVLAWVIGAVMRFPAAGEEIPVTVTMEAWAGGERWVRGFAGRRFLSHLQKGGPPGCIREHFGPFGFDIALRVRDGRLHWPVVAGRFLGMPLPHFSLPGSETMEYVDETGRVWFDVAISAPLAGLIVHYKGWLESDEKAA